jgi:hypothetical protein
VKKLAALLIFALAGCTSAGSHFNTDSDEVASCFTASGSVTFAGQSSGATSGCKCQISPGAGLRVTEASVSSDGSQCYMKADIEELSE